jgi:hypothetical protein
MQKALHFCKALAPPVHMGLEPIPYVRDMINTARAGL